MLVRIKGMSVAFLFVLHLHLFVVSVVARSQASNFAYLNNTCVAVDKKDGNLTSGGDGRSSSVATAGINNASNSSSTEAEERSGRQDRLLQRGGYSGDGATASSSSSSKGGIMDTEFCGMLFRGIANPGHLANWRAIPVRQTDVFYVTAPPSGNAKNPGLGIIRALLENAVTVSGHSEFHDWEKDPKGEQLNVQGFSGSFADLTAATENKRIFGTHVPFEWLPTGVLNPETPGTAPKVVYLVREPKENFVHANDFNSGDAASLTTLINMHVAAVDGTGKGELGAPNRGYAAFANGYAAALGNAASSAVTKGGPSVFLLSQAHLADPNTVQAHVASLAAFLGIKDYNAAAHSSRIESTQKSAATSMGDVTKLTSEQAKLVEDTFASSSIVDPRVTALYTTSSQANSEEQDRASASSTTTRPTGRTGAAQSTTSAATVTASYIATEELPDAVTAAQLLASVAYKSAKEAGIAAALDVDVKTVTVTEFVISAATLRRGLSDEMSRNSLSSPGARRGLTTNSKSVTTKYEVQVITSGAGAVATLESAVADSSLAAKISTETAAAMDAQDWTAAGGALSAKPATFTVASVAYEGTATVQPAADEPESPGERATTSFATALLTGRVRSASTVVLFLLHFFLVLRAQSIWMTA